MRVLVVEDERKSATYIKRDLVEQGYAVDIAYTGRADDYLVKPFALKELLARLRALSCRSEEAPKSTAIHVANLTLDTATHRVQHGQTDVQLTAKEFAILEYLMRHPDHVLTRATIADHVWSYDTCNQSNGVDVYIRNLRRKIDDAFELKLIRRWVPSVRS